MSNKKNMSLKTNQAWCKGCGICVAFCPVKILELKKEKIHVTDWEKCIKCGLCELRCPDFAIYLEEEENGQ